MRYKGLFQWTPAIIAVCMTIIEIVAILNGIDGKVLVAVMTLLALIAGVKLRDIQAVRRVMGDMPRVTPARYLVPSVIKCPRCDTIYTQSQLGLENIRNYPGATILCDTEGCGCQFDVKFQSEHD